MSIQLELQLRRRTDALHYLLGFIHASGQHTGNVAHCEQAGCVEAKHALNDPPQPAREPRHDFVMPDQIWRNAINPAYRIKIVSVDGPNATAQGITPKGVPTGAVLHVRMDGLRALVGYTRDHEAEQLGFGRGA